jgi:hypothetical protein
MSDIDGINSFWIQARAEWESERTALVNENKRLRAALESIITFAEMQNFKSHALSLVKSAAEKALKGRFGV